MYVVGNWIEGNVGNLSFTDGWLDNSGYIITQRIVFVKEQDVSWFKTLGITKTNGQSYEDE